MMASLPRFTSYQALPPSTPTVTVNAPSGEVNFTSLAIAIMLIARNIHTNKAILFIIF